MTEKHETEENLIEIGKVMLGFIQHCAEKRECDEGTGAHHKYYCRKCKAQSILDRIDSLPPEGPK